jgi:DMSO/TMAO reductase YedYZ molybdopterin-dependent catalytic subunit
VKLRRPRHLRRTLVAGATGIVVAIVALAVAEALTVVARSWRSPVLDVGDRMVDLMSQYPRLKQAAIDLLGNADKPALLIGIGVFLLIYAFVLGVVAIRRSLRVGLAMIGLFAVIGVWAALGRKSDGSLFSTLPTIIGSLAAGAALWVLHPRIATTPETAEASTDDEWDKPTLALAGAGSDRRSFLVGSGALLGATAAGSAVFGLGGRQLAKRRFSAAGSRKNVTVPTAEDALPALPTGVQADVPGMTPFITPNDRFYRVDTALEVPQLTTASYRLKIKGMVDTELELTWQDLLNRPMIERDITLTCVSNAVGGSYVGTARWIGARLDDLLREAGPLDHADMVVGRSSDGWESGFPLENALDGRDAMIAVAMNGEALPLEHGFPARLVVPGLYGYVSATKWLTEIEVTRFDEFDHYWEKRGWAEKAPIKLMSRIDVPKGLAKVTAGEVAVGGVAWQQHVGVSKVELRFDDGEWVEATLAEQDTLDTWRQWSHVWNATPGRHTIRVRATDADGNVQTDQRAEPIPDGATGHHQIVVIAE